MRASPDAPGYAEIGDGMNPAGETADNGRDALVARAERAVLDEFGPAYAVVDGDSALVRSGGRIERYLSLKKDAASRDILSAAQDGLRKELRAVLHRTMNEQTEVVRESVRLETQSGPRRVRLVCRPLADDGSEFAGHLLLLFHDLGVEPPLGEALVSAQQSFVASIGNESLRGQSAEALMRTLPDELARLLNVDFVKILRHRPETDDFVLEAEHGFSYPTGTVIPAGLNSQGGYALHTETPIVVENLAQERRFQRPSFLSAEGAVSGLSVLIGDSRSPWGVLGAHTRTRRRFTADEVQFVQSIANVIAATLQRDAWAHHQQLLLDELRHRVKNSLATVQAIAALSFQNKELGPEDVVRFQSRLQALAAAHDLRFQGDGSDVDFGDLVRRQLGPYVGETNRIAVSGPAGVFVGPSATIDMTMVIHELVTNAVKYGALSVDEGRLAVLWRRQSQEHEEFLVFEWTETHGPPIADTERIKGVGTRLMEAISNSSKFRVERDFRPEGLCCRIEVQLDEGRVI